MKSWTILLAATVVLTLAVLLTWLSLLVKSDYCCGGAGYGFPSAMIHPHAGKSMLLGVLDVGRIPMYPEDVTGRPMGLDSGAAAINVFIYSAVLLPFAALFLWAKRVFKKKTARNAP